jgi:hypothetical protein
MEKRKMETPMEQEVIKTNGSTFAHLKERAQHWQADAKEALTAARHDYEHARDALRRLRSRSQLLSYMQTRLGNSTPTKSASAQRAGKGAGSAAK